MNAEDRRRLDELDRRRDLAVEGLGLGGGIVTMTVRVGRDGHVCRRECSLRVEMFPLDQRVEAGGS